MPDKKKVWKHILESVKVAVSPAIFSTWFSQTHLSELTLKKEKYTAKIGCSSSFVKTTIESRYFGLVQDSLEKELGKKCNLIFIVKEEKKSKTQKKEEISPLFENRREEDLNASLAKANVRPTFTFENFAVSTTNQMAWAAAEAVYKNPGGAYNPLFIWGGVGVGKTHLMNSIGFSTLRDNQDAKVLFCTGERFTNEIVEGIRNKSTNKFRDKYRKLDVLLIDDIQFIAGKDAVQEEFFHTFNELVASGSQVVMTSDKPPSEISKLEERLKSRFEAGLLVDVAQPDFELRCAIIQIKASERGIELENEHVHLIAGNIDSPRKIEGFLVRLLSESQIKKLEITKDMVQSVLGKDVDIDNSFQRINPKELISAITKHFSINKTSLLGKSRVRTYVVPRQILMYLLRTELKLPFQQVGEIVGRDHTTVMHAVGKISSLTSKDVQIRQDILGIKNNL